MAYKIEWTLQSISTFEDIIHYLEKEWTKREVENFVLEVEEKLKLIADRPRLYKESSKKKNVHRTVITRQTSLVYRVKSLKKEIELILFWDNRKNTKKLKY